MLASEIRKKNLTPEEINYLVNTSGLKSIQPLLEKILIKSRKNMSPIQLLELQGEIAEKIIIYEKQIAIFRKSADRVKRNDEWRSREIYKAHRKMLKEVMDGMAFRFLNFDRPVLRQLVEHSQTGHLSQGFITELDKAEYIVKKTGFYVILNDLTNFLRFGDLTIISPDGYLIDEVKTTGRAKGNQKKSLDQLIKMLNRKVFQSGDQSAQYIKISGKPANFLNQVSVIINKSKSKPEGVYSEKVSPYLWVSSIYLPRIKEYFNNKNTMPNFPKPPFNKKDYKVPMNSLMFFDDFSPNLLPSSVYPFSEKVISELMIGQIQLKVILNEKELIKSIKGKGWELILPSREDIISIYDLDDIDKIKEAIRNPDFFPTLKKGQFSFKMPREVILRIESEFRSAKAIVDEAEGLMASTKSRITSMVTTNFSEEHLVWR